MLTALLALVAAAGAQVVEAVPPHVRAVTVHACDRPRGCGEAEAAYAAHAAEHGLPFLSLDDVLAAGPEGGEARAAWDAAWAAVQVDELDLDDPDLSELDTAWQALAGLPLSMPAEVPWTLLLLRADRRLAAGDQVGARSDLAAAGSSSGWRVHDLPPLTEELRTLYLEAADARSPRRRTTLRVASEASPTTVFVDGEPVGIAPVEVELLAGWHRLSAERPGRAAAWVGTVDLPEGGVFQTTAEVVPEDASQALRSTLLAGTRDRFTDPVAIELLVDWARQRGLRWVRVVRVVRPDVTAREGDRAPEEVVEAPDRSTWHAHAAWIDVARGRYVSRGPGPGSMEVLADPERVRIGGHMGPEGLGGRMHASMEAVVLARVHPWVALDVRVGLLHSGQTYYLYENWSDENLYTVRLGARVGRSGGGPYGGLQADVIIPYALGGHALAGWELAPTSRWRVGLEGRVGATDVGVQGGVQLSLARRN